MNILTLTLLFIFTHSLYSMQPSTNEYGMDDATYQDLCERGKNLPAPTLPIVLTKEQADKAFGPVNNQELFDAVENDKLYTAEILLARGADVTYDPKPTPKSPKFLMLATALKKSNPAMMRLLLQHTPNTKTNPFLPVFLQAAIDLYDETLTQPTKQLSELSIKRYGAIQVLLDAGITFQANALHDALSREYFYSFHHHAYPPLSVAHLLLKHGANARQSTNNDPNMTALNFAAISYNLPILKRMHDLGFCTPQDLNDTSASNVKPLHSSVFAFAACTSNKLYEQTIAFLLSIGCDPRVQATNEKKTALELIEIVLEKEPTVQNLSPATQNENRLTLLKVRKALKTKVAELNQQKKATTSTQQPATKDLKTALRDAFQKYYTETKKQRSQTSVDDCYQAIKELLHDGAPCTTFDLINMLALEYDLKREKKSVSGPALSLLLLDYVEKPTSDKPDDSALEMAARSYNVAVLKRMHEIGYCTPARLNYQGAAILPDCIFGLYSESDINAYAATISYLLEIGADPRVKGPLGRTALECLDCTKKLAPKIAELQKLSINNINAVFSQLENALKTKIKELESQDKK